MSEPGVVDITGPDAGKFADYLSIVVDLRFVAEACARLEDLQSTPATDQDPLLVRALWVSALITYRRCFTGGKGQVVLHTRRTAIPDTVMSTLSAGQLALHEELFLLADQHIAHRANDELEQIKLVIRLVDPPGPRGIFSVANMLAVHIAGSPEQVKALRSIATHLADCLGVEVESLQTRIASKAHQVEVDELYGLTAIEFY